MRCPCGLGLAYDACCGPLHRGEAVAGTAEQLMRSRYSAFAVGDPAYLLLTWHPTTRPRRLRLDDPAPDGAPHWLRLEIVGRSTGGLLDTEGTVEFRAHSRAGVQHEISRFVRDGRWLYVGPRQPRER